MPISKDKIPPQDFKPGNLAVLIAFSLSLLVYIAICGYIVLVIMK